MSQPLNVVYNAEPESFVIETGELEALNTVVSQLADSRGWSAMRALAVADAWCRQTGNHLGVIERGRVLDTAVQST